MLKIEKLVCKNPEFHKDCRWKYMGLTYPDAQYIIIKRRLEQRVRASNMAYRISHDKLGLLITLKLGHDGWLFSNEDKGKINRL